MSEPALKLDAETPWSRREVAYRAAERVHVKAMKRIRDAADRLGQMADAEDANLKLKRDAAHAEYLRALREAS